MLEMPNFDQIARRLIVLIDPQGADEDEHPIDDLHRRAIANQLAAVVEQLRQVWNARGAADIAGLTDPVTNAVDDWVRAGAGTYDELQSVVEQTLTSTLPSLDCQLPENSTSTK